MVVLKKISSSAFVFLFLFSLLCATTWRISAKAGSAIIYVPTDSPTIQEAVDRARPGDTIFVHNGTYQEDIVINKSVSVVGEHRDSTIIYGLQADYVVSITANDVSFKGFTVKKNEISPYGNGMLIVSIGNVVQHNKISESYDGLIIYFSGKNTISDNIISGNYEGISLYFSSNNLISGNTISGNTKGIVLSFSSNNMLSGNTFFGNIAGIDLSFSSHTNVLYHNNFHDAVQVSSDSTNFWVLAGEGNYWANYTGEDSDSDGIGDRPFIIDARNRDNYPLMGMFYAFSVLLKSETYHINIICNSTVSAFKFEIGDETGNKIVHFNVTSEDDTVRFCRIMIPAKLMSYPSVVVDGEETTTTPLSVSNDTHTYLYFTYTHSSQAIAVISSRTLYLYNDLLNKYIKLQVGIYNLSSIYNGLLGNYTSLLENYSQMQQSYFALNSSYQEHLSDFSENLENIQNLMYIFAATTGIFLATTVYLSKRAHTVTATKN